MRIDNIVVSASVHRSSVTFKPSKFDNFKIKSVISLTISISNDSRGGYGPKKLAFLLYQLTSSEAQTISGYDYDQLRRERLNYEIA